MARVRRAVWRIVSPLVDLNPPRGVGTACVLTIMAASVGYGVAKGGHGADLLVQAHELCNSAANGAGLRISSVTLSGQSHLQRDDVLGLAGVYDGSSLLCLDAGSARTRLMDNPWIAEATVLKLYPGRLQIGITERAPAALWQKDGAVNVIAIDGKVLEPFGDPRFAALPLVVGEGADREAGELIALLGRNPSIRDTVKSSVLVAKRRWNLNLKNGIDVRLPEDNPDAALQRLAELVRSKNLLARDITAIDLRLPDRIVVRLSDDAAQARTEAINAAIKDKKRKSHPKGSET